MLAGPASCFQKTNRLASASQQSTVYSLVYSGLGDRLSQTVNGTQTRYVNDLSGGLTRVLADGTNTYLYGIGHIAQQGATTQYFGAHALGSSLS